MKKKTLTLAALFISLYFFSFSTNDRYEILLNENIDFEQTKTSLPPMKFTKKTQIPRLVDNTTKNNMNVKNFLNININNHHISHL